MSQQPPDLRRPRPAGTRMVHTAALAAALTVPLLIVGFIVFTPDRSCRGPAPCPGSIVDPDETLWRAVVAAAVVQLLIVGGRAGWLAFHRVGARLRPATLLAVAVTALAIGPVAAGAEAPELLGDDELSGFALVWIGCPLVLIAVHWIGERRAAIAVLASLLPSCLFFPLWEDDWALATGYPLLLWAVTLPIALVR